MVERRIVSKEQVYYAIKNGEFGKEIIEAGNVLVVMTQDWCPQWTSMKSVVYESDIEQDIMVFELVYNGTEYYNDFMKFKENTFKNHEIPYMRFYRNGTMGFECNYTGRQAFKDKLRDHFGE